MPAPTRRAFLGGVATSLAAVPGCTGRDDATTSTDRDSTTDTASPTATASPSRTLRLAPTSPSDLDADASLFVSPEPLRDWLREAATTDGTLRVHATASVVTPDPPLPAFDRVRLAGAGDADGRYEVDVDAGIRYEYLAGAEAVTPPADATVTPVSDLPPERRRLAVAAIEGDVGDAARFFPETALGEWARTTFFGGYFRRDGTVYRGHEVRQTDAAFFSHECWYVLSMDSAEGGDGPTFDLAAVDADVRRAVDDLLSSRRPTEPVTRDATDVPSSVVQFFAETDALLTHAAVLEATVERDDA